MKCNLKIWFVLPMRCLLFIATFFLCSIITQRNLTGITHWWSILASVINIVTIIVLWIICKRNNTTYREMIHYEKSKKHFQRIPVYCHNVVDRYGRNVFGRMALLR